MNNRQNIFKIISNEKVCGSFYRMTIDARPILKSLKPGQFVNIKVSDGIEPFFRLPFSISRSQGSLEILYDVIGQGTSILSSRKKGEEIDVLGPLGNSFSAPAKNIKQVVMIAGGIGIAPFISLSDKLKNSKCGKILLYGGRTKEHICSKKIFKKNGCKVYVSTDDGSMGTKGRVSELFSKINLDPSSTYIYTCGPKQMMKAVQRFAVDHSIKGEISNEEVMACGVGTCLGCVCKTQKGYKTVCLDGPVFPIGQIVF